jgi:hypothetical protein
MAGGPPIADPRPRNGGGGLLTPEVEAQFMAALRSGVPIRVAAQSAGVGESTAKQWMQLGRQAVARRERGETLSEHEEACAKLATQVQRTYDETHVLLAGRIVQASAKDWRAASWMLQRRHPEVWNLPDQIEVTGRGGGPVEVAAIVARAEEWLAEEPSGNGQRALDV